MLDEITVTAHIQARAGKEAEVEQVLQALVAPTQAEPGCMRYDLFAMPEKPGCYLFIETWKSPGHLNRHLQQNHVQAFIGRSQELLAEPLQVASWKKIPGP
jgi:quinol monooxygenase YgiN